MGVSSRECAREVLEVVPLVMRVIRAAMRQASAPTLSVPQFRVLVFINRREQASPTQVAEHIGLTLPSMTKLLDGLVRRGLVQRHAHPSDRRRQVLRLTPQGDRELRVALASAQSHLASLLDTLPEDKRDTVASAMAILRSIVDGDGTPLSHKEGEPHGDPGN